MYQYSVTTFMTTFNFSCFIDKKNKREREI